MEAIKGKYSELHHLIYVHSLLLIAVGLPFSEIMLSFGQFILVINWLWEGGFQKKWKRIISNKSLLIFLLLYGVHVLWLLNTQNFHYALHDLKMKLPLLVLPLIVSTSGELTKKEIEKILHYFISFVVIASFIVFMVSLGFLDFKTADNRSISIFISHIRFSLMINISIFFLGLFLIQKWNLYKVSTKTMLILLILWLIFFLFVLQSVTGIIIFILFTPFFLLRFFLKIKNFMFRYFMIILLITGVLLVSTFVSHAVGKFYNVEKIDFTNLPEKTEDGNAYQKFNDNLVIENGHYIWVNVCVPEIKKWWNTNSRIPFDSLDNKGQRIKNTFIRYMASKGLKKDKQGCQNLTEVDVRNVEKGMTNYLMTDRFSIYNIVYKILWQIDVYKKTDDCNNHSVVQRFEYWKTGKRILFRNFLFGVGTGDIQDEFNTDYQLNESKLSLQNRHRTHNQFLTFAIAFGIIGFLIILIALFFPVFKLWDKDFAFMIFLIVILLSFLNEDTLETQTGVTFFAFFYSIFLFGKKRLKHEKT